jgi:hypothetical protein
MVKSSVSDGPLLVFRVFLMLSLQHLVMNGEMKVGIEERPSVKERRDQLVS